MLLAAHRAPIFFKLLTASVSGESARLVPFVDTIVHELLLTQLCWWCYSRVGALLQLEECVLRYLS